MSQATPRRESAAAKDIADTTKELRDKAMAGAERAAEEVSSAARHLADQGREVTENVSAVADNFQRALNKSIREQPMTTVAAAVIVGFVLGAIWKS
jgi:ElaB/YqjD/DUF883 family membrane-anchored ribosome-binding protein